MKAIETRREIQRALHVSDDGSIGPRTMAALTLLNSLPDDAEWPLPSITAPLGEWHRVKASSFADESDVRAFRACKADGGSDQYCFAKGDNGIGFTGLDCTDPENPYVALPPEKWKPRFGSAGAASRKPVRVRINGVEVLCLIGDTMPHEGNVTNGAGIDLAVGAQKAFGLRAPFMVDAEWAWG